MQARLKLSTKTYDACTEATCETPQSLLYIATGTGWAGKSARLGPDQHQRGARSPAGSDERQAQGLLTGLESISGNSIFPRRPYESLLFKAFAKVFGGRCSAWTLQEDVLSTS